MTDRLQFLRETGLRLSYALMRIAAHHFIHAGEIVTVRSRLGHDTDSLARPDWGRPPSLNAASSATLSLGDPLLSGGGRSMLTFLST